MPRAMAADATKKMLRQAKVKFHPDKVWAWVWGWNILQGVGWGGGGVEGALEGASR